MTRRHLEAGLASEAVDFTIQRVKQETPLWPFGRRRQAYCQFGSCLNREHTCTIQVLPLSPVYPSGRTLESGKISRDRPITQRLSEEWPPQPRCLSSRYGMPGPGIGVSAWTRGKQALPRRWHLITMSPEGCSYDTT